MGMSFSCPFSNLDDLEAQLDSFLLAKQNNTSLGGGDAKTVIPCLSFNGRDSKLTLVKSLGIGKMILRGSLSFDGKQVETRIALEAPSACDLDNNTGMPTSNSMPIPETSDFTPKKCCAVPNSPEPADQRHQAAVKLQKTYKSFRTRRRLADCAVLVEQRWWKLLDFAELKQTSVSFFAIEKQETAVSRWSRARKKAAKVGKGLSKAEKARKLALQHWLEAIDPRHRYGHNLQFYYVKWLHCESRQPFFYWLDVGEGKEVNLEKCPRPKLQQQCIKYLGPRERNAYEVVIEDGRFLYKQSGEFLDTTKGPEDAKWIFVLSVSKILYVGQKKKGTFQHSSFLAGGATLSAGRLVVEDGILKAIWPHSGHYLPTEENMEEFMAFLEEHNVDLNVIQREPTGEDELPVLKEEKSVCLRSSTSEPNLSCTSSKTDVNVSDEWEDSFNKKRGKDLETSQPSISRLSRGMYPRIAALEIPKRDKIIELFMEGKERLSSARDTHDMDSASDGYETAEENLSDSEFYISKKNLFDPCEEEYEDPIPKEKIMKRIDSHRRTKSYQLAYQLSCRWTTGAGPRIGCVRDYPSELQTIALEEMYLSPRAVFSTPRKSTQSVPGIDAPINRHREPAGRSLFAP